MNFNEICQLAETTRDEVYGLRVGSDRFGHDAVAFVSDIVPPWKNPPNHLTSVESVRSVKTLPFIVLRLKRTESSPMMMRLILIQWHNIVLNLLSSLAVSVPE